MQREFEFRIVKNNLQPDVGMSLLPPLVLTVGAGSGVLGRAPGCRYLIPDSSRVISREHALIERLQDRVYWTPRGSNPTLLQGNVLQAGKRHPLTPGDVLELGPYSVHFVQRESTPCPLSNPPMAAQEEAVWPQDSSLVESWSIDAVLSPEPLSMATPSDDGAAPLPLRTPVQSHRLWLDDLDPPPSRQSTKVDDPSPVVAKGWVDALGLAFIQPWEDAQTQRLNVVLHQSIALLLSLLEARRLMRQELGGHQTTIRARSNNPLKVAVTVNQALTHLLHPESVAYLSAEEAFEELSGDLLGESSHLLNAMRQLMAKLDQHLAPRQIEQQLDRMSGITLPIGVHRKARMWDLFCQQYPLLRGERSLPFASLLEDALRDAPVPGQDR